MTFPLDQDDYLLQQLGSAEEEARDLWQAGSEVMRQLGWTLDQYGRSVKRLVDGRLLEAQLQVAGDGKYVSVYPTALTNVGWFKIKQLRAEQDLN